MKATALVFVAALVFAPQGPVQAQQRQPTVVQCASNDGRVQRCAADVRGGVVLQTQYSRSGCYQNETWGYEPGSIWVSNGCRASFLVGQPPLQHGNGNRNQAATVAALAIVAAAVVASQHDRRDNRNNDDEGEYNRGCAAARQNAGLPSYAGAAYRNGYLDCARR